MRRDGLKLLQGMGSGDELTSILGAEYAMIARALGILDSTTPSTSTRSTEPAAPVGSLTQQSTVATVPSTAASSSRIVGAGVASQSHSETVQPPSKRRKVLHYDENDVIDLTSN